ncbi:hypothetical protein BC826DRAFT_1177769 [Russula brevipes]|nr:hypothetical protein BC826DRAFT_1177769 [Russula brevipes]
MASVSASGFEQVNCQRRVPRACEHLRDPCGLAIRPRSSPTATSRLARLVASDDTRRARDEVKYPCEHLGRQRTEIGASVLRCVSRARVRSIAASISLSTVETPRRARWVFVRRTGIDSRGIRGGLTVRQRTWPLAHHLRGARASAKADTIGRIPTSLEEMGNGVTNVDFRCRVRCDAQADGGANQIATLHMPASTPSFPLDTCATYAEYYRIEGVGVGTLLVVQTEARSWLHDPYHTTVDSWRSFKEVFRLCPNCESEQAATEPPVHLSTGIIIDWV